MTLIIVAVVLISCFDLRAMLMQKQNKALGIYIALALAALIWGYFYTQHPQYAGITEPLIKSLGLE